MKGPRLSAFALALACAIGVIAGCDRAVEPFDPDEKPEQPDLSRIFPEGAEGPAPLPELPPAPSPRGGRGAPPVASSSEPLRGTVRLAPGLESSVPSGAILFLIARPGTAGPPLAVVRVPRPEFPFEFSIGPEDRMIEAMPFAGPLRITARVDADGNATSRSPGDLQGAAAGAHQPGDVEIEVLIDEVL